LFAPYQEEHPLPRDAAVDNAIPLSRFFDFEYLAHQFEDRVGFQFRFKVKAWTSVNLHELCDGQSIERNTEETDTHRRIQIVSHLQPRNPENVSLVLRNYPQIVGNLDEEIIWGIRMFEGGRATSWQIEVDTINQLFTIESFNSMVAQALRSQSRTPLERIPAFLRRVYPESSGQILEVVVTVPAIVPEEVYVMDIDLHDIAGDLYCSTNIPELDQCICDIHLQLLEYGIPVGPETEVYQRVLSQLLIYRYCCASTTGYIDANVARQTEVEGFHRHLCERLAHQLGIVPVGIVSEPEVGNSRVDLLIEGIPTELKLEDRRTATTDSIVSRYEGQAADYIARQGAPFGFLLVLDTILDRTQPTSPVAQDLRVSRVLNVSGGTVVVIAIVVRIPRPASDHSRLSSHSDE
jgi:hypothetical protein